MFYELCVRRKIYNHTTKKYLFYVSYLDLLLNVFNPYFTKIVYVLKIYENISFKMKHCI